eukprot:6214609-Pleurochrysis_carterae.AAC.4
MFTSRVGDGGQQRPTAGCTIFAELEQLKAACTFDEAGTLQKRNREHSTASNLSKTEQVIKIKQARPAICAGAEAAWVAVRIHSGSESDGFAMSRTRLSTCAHARRRSESDKFTSTEPQEAAKAE